MNVTLCSAFRNSESAGHLDRYFQQIRELDNLLYWRSDALTLLLGEGDSTDDTRAELERHMNRHGFTGEIIDVTHGGKEYGSVVDATRFKQLAYVGNKLWSQIPESADVAIWCESDLIFEASTMLALIDDLEQVPCVAPMVMHKTNPGLYEGDGPFFYDVWGHRRNGVRFTNQPPYHPDLYKASINGGMLQMDSVGSCVVMNAELARHVRFEEEDCIVGLCRKAREYGASIYCDTGLAVFHP